MKNKPLFIVFEGIDGSGKSTQSAMLRDYLNGKGIDSVLLREPTPGPFGLEIRRLLAGDAFPPVRELSRLFIKDRYDDALKNILPALAEGRVVVMDRYYFSNAAYQGGDEMPWREILDENIREGFPVPDRVYLIDVDVDVALERIQGRLGGKEGEIFEQRGFLAKVRDNYREMADGSFFIIDGRNSVDAVFAAITADLDALR